MALRLGGGCSTRQAGASGHGSPGRGDPARGPDGVSVTRPRADTEGARHGARCWVAVEGVSERSERRRASDEGPRTRLAKGNLHGVEDRASSHPQHRHNKSLTQWKRKERPLKARGAKESLHGVENETSPSHPRGKTKASRSGDKKKEGPEGPRVQEERSDYTQPRNLMAVTTRSMATMYAALRM